MLLIIPQENIEYAKLIIIYYSYIKFGQSVKLLKSELSNVQSVCGQNYFGCEPYMAYILADVALVLVNVTAFFYGHRFHIKTIPATVLFAS